MFVKLVDRFEKILFALTLFLLTDNFNPYIGFISRKPYIWLAVHLLTGMPRSEVANAVRTWSSAIFSFYLDGAFCFVLLMLFLRPGLFAKVLKMILNNMGMVALLLFACASWFWSVTPNATLGGLYLVLKITIVAIYISQRYSPEEILGLLIWVITLASLLSIFAVWKTPEQSIHLGGEWRGIYGWKNYLGRLMAFGNIILIVYWFNNSAILKRVFALGLFILTGVLLVFSASTTSIIIVLEIYSGFIVYGVWTRWIVRWNRRIRWSLLISGIAAVILTIWNASLIFALLNKTSTLLQRIALWETLWGWFQKSPIFGFGYEAFWPQFPNGISPPGWTESAAMHAHNGYFEIALALGFAGLILFLFALAASWKRAFTLLREKRQIIFLWPLLALFYLTFANLTYSIAFGFPDFHWALFVIVAGLVPSTRPELWHRHDFAPKSL